MVQSEFVDGKHGFTVGSRLTFGIVKFPLYYLDVVFAGEVAQGFVVGELFMLHYEVDRRASFAATETFADITSLVY